MKYTLVYTTYENDLEWLKWSLKSVKKYVFPFNQISKIIIYTHDICKQEVETISNEVFYFGQTRNKVNINVIPIEYDYHGYIKQMTLKCNAFNDIETEYLVYLDSA